MAMTGVGWGLTIGAAVGWAVLDALRKRLAVDKAPLPLAAWLALGPVPLFALWAWADGASWPSWSYGAPLVASVVLNGVANVLFVGALRASPLGVTIPTLSLTPALSTLGAWAVLGEVPDPWMLLGVLGIVVGTLALPFAGGLSTASLRGQRGVPMMAAVALCWALSLVVDKAALQSAAVPMHLAISTAVVGVLLAAGVVVLGRGRELVPTASDGTGVLAVVTVLAVAMGVQLLALEQVPVAVVDATKRAIGMVLAVGLGWAMFGERLTLGQGAVLVGLMGAVGALALG